MAKAPKPRSDAETDGSDSNTITLTIEGVSHTVNFGAFNALQAAQLHRVTGVRFNEFVDRCCPPNPFDLEAVAVFVWAAGVQAGDPPAFSEVAESITGEGMRQFVSDALEAIDEPAEPGDPKG